MIIEGYAYTGKRNEQYEILLTVFKTQRDKTKKVKVTVEEVDE